MESVKEKLVRPSLAKRLAQAACVTAALVNPLYELVGMVKPQVANHGDRLFFYLNLDADLRGPRFLWKAHQLQDRL